MVKGIELTLRLRNVLYFIVICFNNKNKNNNCLTGHPEHLDISALAAQWLGIPHVLNVWHFFDCQSALTVPMTFFIRGWGCLTEYLEMELVYKQKSFLALLLNDEIKICDCYLKCMCCLFIFLNIVFFMLYICQIE